MGVTDCMLPRQVIVAQGGCVVCTDGLDMDTALRELYGTHWKGSLQERCGRCCAIQSIIARASKFRTLGRV
eukprot:1240911-Prymnesium_polylepis.1